MIGAFVSPSLSCTARSTVYIELNCATGFCCDASCRNMQFFKNTLPFAWRESRCCSIVPLLVAPRVCMYAFVGMVDVGCRPSMRHTDITHTAITLKEDKVRFKQMNSYRNYFETHGGSERALLEELKKPQLLSSSVEYVRPTKHYFSTTDLNSTIDVCPIQMNITILNTQICSES